MAKHRIFVGLKAGTASLALGCALASTAAFGQTADTPTQTTGSDAAQQQQAPAGPQEGLPPTADTNGTSASPASGQDVVVTGSRIPQPNLTGVAPVTVLNSQDIKLQGTTRVEDLLNSLPQVFAGQASTVSNGSDGTASVDLRGLGPSRTLVLINGRRLVPGDPGTPGVGSSPSSGSSADLNAIPASLIKRVEVLTGGASATYGADAVAGVVNFVMDTDFTGVRLDSQYSFYDHSNRNKITPPILQTRQAAGLAGYGYPDGHVADGGTIDATLTVGAGNDQGHVVGYFGYRKVKPVLQSNRDYSACTIQNGGSGALQCGGSATAAPGNAIFFTEAGGTSSTAYQIGPNRTLVPGLGRYNFAPTNFYQRNDERYTGGFFAHYDLDDAVKPYMEFNFMDDRSNAQIAPSGDFGNTLTINCDNPLLGDAANPDSARNILCTPANTITGFLGNFPLAQAKNPDPTAPPLVFTDPTTGRQYNRAFFQLLRRNVEGGPRSADLQHTEYRGVVGAKGDIDPAFSYDVYYQYGRTNFALTYLREFSVARLNNALDVVTGSDGNPVCRTATIPGGDTTCVPYDVFGGNPSQAAIDYVSSTGFQRGRTTEQVASGSITGQLGKYGIQTPWSSDGLSFNIGAEYRKEAVDLEVDNGFLTGDLTGQGGATLPIAGSYNVKEAFGEIQLPVVTDNFIYSLSLNAGYRYSHYEISNGNKFNTNTYKFGAEFAPIRDIKLRGSYNRAVRVPNLQELFATPHVALDGSTDPCAGFAITAADTGCIAQGLKVGQTVAPNPAGQYNGLIGGVSTLRPEKATTKSFGVVLQPSFLPRLAVTVDYFDIKVKNAIQGFGADAILKACTNSDNALACGLIHRNPVTGSLWLTTDGYVDDLARNIGSLKTRGIDVNGSFSQPLGDIGSLSLSLTGTYLDKFQTNNGLTEPYDCRGYYGVTCGVPAPKWRHRARIGFTLPEGIGLSAQWRYFGPVKVDYTNPSDTTAGSFFPFGSKLGSQSYFDLALTAPIGDHYTFRIGANNILDRQPPLVTSGNPNTGAGNACPTGPCNGNSYPAVYDSLGRYIFAGVTLDF